MAFMSGDFVYVAGNLATDPRMGQFPAKDGMYDEVVWLTVAVNHTDAATEYVELEARGRTKEYIKNLAAVTVDPLCKGSFVMAGGGPAKAKGNKRKLKLVVFSSETSLGYDVLNWERLHKDGKSDE